MKRISLKLTGRVLALGFFLGLALALSGLYLLVGLAWTLIAAGVVLAGLCLITDADDSTPAPSNRGLR